MSEPSADVSAYLDVLQRREHALALPLQTRSLGAGARARLGLLRAQTAALRAHSAHAAAESRRRREGRLGVVVADADPCVCALLTTLLESIDGRFEVLAAVEDGAQALGAVIARRPEALVLDDRLPLVDWQEVAADVRVFAPATVVALHAPPEDGPFPGADLVLPRGTGALKIGPALLAACGRG
jgi:CheY-like chemotaxis protein